MNSEVFEIVMQEIVQEQKETNLVNAQMAAYVKSLSDKIELLAKKNEEQRKLIELGHAQLMKTFLDSETSIRSGIAAKPDHIVHKKVFQLFPSLNIREYYHVYGNLFKWVSLFGSFCLVIRLIRDLLEKQGYL